jgi:hypothetical protein
MVTNQYWIKFRECLLACNSEYFVFLSAFQKHMKCRKMYLPVVLYGHETGLMLQEEHRLRVFVNGIKESIWA